MQAAKAKPGNNLRQTVESLTPPGCPFPAGHFKTEHRHSQRRIDRSNRPKSTYYTAKQCICRPPKRSLGTIYVRQWNRLHRLVALSPYATLLQSTVTVRGGLIGQTDRSRHTTLQNSVYAGRQSEAWEQSTSDSRIAYTAGLPFPCWTFQNRTPPQSEAD